MLTAHHHSSIGGAYAKIFDAKGIDASQMQKFTDKYSKADHIGWSTKNPDKKTAEERRATGEDEIERIVKGSSGTGSLAELMQDKVYNEAKVTSEELFAIRFYSQLGFKTMNATMQDLRLANSKEQKHFKGHMTYAQLVASGLSKLPSYKEKRFVYRLESDFGGLPQTAQIGTTFLTANFLSTSYDPINANVGGSNGWLIYLAPNSKGKDITPIVGKLEKEVLFPPGSKLKVVDVVRRTGPKSQQYFELTDEQKDDDIRRVWQTDSGKPLDADMLKDIKRRFHQTSGSKFLIIAQELG
jgi:hypothetical protein